MKKRILWISFVFMFLVSGLNLVQAEESLFTWREDHFTPYFQSKTLQEYYGKMTVKVIDKHETQGYGSSFGGLLNILRSGKIWRLSFNQLRKARFFKSIGKPLNLRKKKNL